MSKKNAIYILTAVVSVLFLQSPSSAQQNPHSEQITITTYYPSPSGRYNQLSVGNGGLKLGKTVDNVPANTWTDIDNVSGRSAGLFIVTVVPKDESFVSTSLIVFSADGRNIGLKLLGPSATSNTYDKNEQLKKPTEIAQFRAQHSNGQDLFTLQIMPNKECQVHIGKALSY